MTEEQILENRLQRALDRSEFKQVNSSQERSLADIMDTSAVIAAWIARTPAASDAARRAKASASKLYALHLFDEKDADIETSLSYSILRDVLGFAQGHQLSAVSGP